MRFLWTSIAFLAVAASALVAQNSVALTATLAQPAVGLPDAPQAQGANAAATPPAHPLPPFLLNPLLFKKQLTLNDKFTLYTHEAFGPPAVIAPAFGAAIRMAHPKSTYPKDWQDGAGAFGRLYGSQLATQAGRRSAEFFADAALHDDPRYRRSTATNKAARAAHAFEYVFLQKTDSGNTTLAFPHLAGAAAGGFVGMAYMPPGYNDLTHAGQRATIEFATIAGTNLLQEFSPELAPLFGRLRILRFIPAWWVPEHHAHP